jgi:hypothetical protein
MMRVGRASNHLGADLLSDTHLRLLGYTLPPFAPATSDGEEST